MNDCLKWSLSSFLLSPHRSHAIKQIYIPHSFLHVLQVAFKISLCGCASARCPELCYRSPQQATKPESKHALDAQNSGCQRLQFGRRLLRQNVPMLLDDSVISLPCQGTITLNHPKTQGRNTNTFTRAGSVSSADVAQYTPVVKGSMET